MKAFTVVAPLLLALTATMAQAQDATPAPADAKVYFISPKDGARIRGPVTVRFGLEGMGVAPAGVPFPNSGHHHLLVDAELPPPDQPIPADEHHIHFGKGQTETVLNLVPGRHTLQLVLGDHLHIPFNPVVASPKITITVSP